MELKTSSAEAGGHPDMLTSGEKTSLKMLRGQKPSNPKDIIGSTKAPSSTVPRGVLAEVGVGMLEGGCKYGRHNYRVIGVRSSIYFDAAIGHLESWWEGEDIDPDSGLSHITKAICSLVVLRDAMLQDMLNDDRPPKSKIPNMRNHLSSFVQEIIERYPEPKEPYTEQKCQPTK